MRIRSHSITHRSARHAILPRPAATAGAQSLSAWSMPWISSLLLALALVMAFGAAQSAWAQTCHSGELTVRRLKTGKEAFYFQGLIPALVDFNNLNPRADDSDGIRLALNDGLNRVIVHIPGGEGWGRSNIGKGQWKWSGQRSPGGNIGGIRQMVILQQPVGTGRWQVNINGVKVPGAAELAKSNVAAAVMIDGECASGMYKPIE